MWYWRSQLRVVENVQRGQWKDGKSRGIHWWEKVDAFGIALVRFLWTPGGGEHDILLTIAACAIVLQVPTCCHFPDILSI